MLTATDRRPWLVTCRRGDGLRLIGFPYAGGGPSLFRGWPSELLQDIELCAVHLPGREARMKEQPIGDLRRVVAELAKAIEPVCDRPVALFGHSIGGLLAFECARELRRRYGIEPVHLFVSGCPAPQIRDQDRLCELPDEEFVERMRHFNGTPREILDHAEMMELMLPTLRADLRCAIRTSIRPNRRSAARSRPSAGWRTRRSGPSSLRLGERIAPKGFNYGCFRETIFSSGARRRRWWRRWSSSCGP